MPRYLKSERQAKIIELITAEQIPDARTLMQRLREEGYEFDDATGYRDIAELHLAASIRDDGTLGLATPAMIAHESMAERLSKLTVEAALHVDYHGNMVKVRCLRGCADAVAMSIDALRLDQVFASVVARDDVIAFCKSDDDAAFVYRILGRVINR